jgi:hypothetical protein
MGIVPERVLGMGIAREQDREVPGMEIVRVVVRVGDGRHSQGRAVENQRPSHVLLLARRNRTVRHRSLVLLRGLHNLVPRSRRGLRRAVLVLSLVLRTRAGLRNSLGRRGGSHRGHGHSRTGVAAGRTKLCLWNERTR